MISIDVDTRRLAERLEAMADHVGAAVTEEVDALTDELEARITEKLSGGVLQSRSGQLRGSIMAAGTSSQTSFKAELAVADNVKYAAIQEFGGTTSPHDILAVKAKALAFTSGGGDMFATRVHHPGSQIPERSYLRSSLADMKDAILAGLSSAVRRGLQA